MSPSYSCGCGNVDPMEQAKKLLKCIFYSIERGACIKLINKKLILKIIMLIYVCKIFPISCLYRW